ncbi:tetratricopeptide repeat protein [Canna indica]|uniref:Tetratricopeptide repeat protein n=1 Tax=Canna indica TaxID=4628 RepID=A0AAQ3KMY9_9LILI|nr:tetratricopeptide repeat protein [Canna indica]
MATPPNFLKSVELRLLRCTFSQEPNPSPLSSPSSPHSLRPLVEALVGFIERGQFAEALASDAARLVFGFAESWEFQNSPECAVRFYDEVERAVEAFIGDAVSAAWLQVLDTGTESDLDVEGRCALLMCLGVAALLAFMQQNVTGPIGKFSPFPIPFFRLEESSDGGGEWDVWARNKLTAVGSHVHGKFMLLQYFVYAKILLSKIKELILEGGTSYINGCRTLYWWLCRLFLLQQRILEELSSSLYDILQLFKYSTLSQFGKAEHVATYWGIMLYEGEASAIASLAHLEAGIIENKYGRVDSSRSHLECAEEFSGLHLTVTGALGFRTIHQVDAKPQLILAANKDIQNHAQISQFPRDSIGCERKDSDEGGLDDCSDILMTPRLVVNGNNDSLNEHLTHINKDINLTYIQQAVVLAKCLHLQRRSRDDELSGWEMAPYIEAIHSQLQSCYTISSLCDILRIRWESTRSRTKQRALSMMDKLVEIIYDASPVPYQRTPLSYGVYIPTIPALRKEYGELLVSCGLIGEALKVFEDLELWDNLIYCYQLLGKKAAAVDLIKARLDDVPNDPRLWCSLGDVTNTDAYYEKALEVSNNRSARAKRSLARNAYNRGDYETSKTLWESALALNSLYPDGWFALGAAALKARDVDKALDAYTRSVQIDPDNGEAWNNVACLHMVKKKSKAAFIAFKEALKFRRNNWQLWENFSNVALDVGNTRQALEATKMVLDLSNNKRVDVELLDKILKKFEDGERNSNSDLSSSDIQDDGDSCEETNPSQMEAICAEPREIELLLDMLGSILQQIVRSGGPQDIWGLYARWHRIKGNLLMCSEALLKLVRSFQGSELWHNKERFKNFAHASLQLCKVYMEIASSNGSRRELFAAEMHLRSSVKQAVSFSDTDEFKNLKACLDEVKKRIDATSSEGA